jgi:1,4-alpha-glucan branching enzyme
MTIKKQYSKKKPECKVTFKLAKEIAGSVNSVNLAGDFNSWDTESIPLKKLNSGEFTVSVNFEKGREYQFKYLIDGKEWINEKEADKHIPNEFQSENSVVTV